MNSIFYRLSPVHLRHLPVRAYDEYCILWYTCTRRMGIKSKLRTMSFLKSRLSPLPLSLLCSTWGGGCVLIGYYMYTLDSHSSSSFTARQRRPSPRYFYDIFSTLYRFFPPQPKVFSKPTPFFSLRPNGLTFCFIYILLLLLLLLLYIYYQHYFCLLSAVVNGGVGDFAIFSPAELNFISLPFVRKFVTRPYFNLIEGAQVAISLKYTSLYTDSSTIF